MFPIESQFVLLESSRFAQVVLKAALAACGYSQIQVFENADEAWGYLHGMALSAVNPVLILCEQRMTHGLSGMDFLKKVRAHPATASVPFVMMSAEWDRIRLVEALGAGATGYLVKPYTHEDLQRTLQFTWKRAGFESTSSASKAVP